MDASRGSSKPSEGLRDVQAFIYLYDVGGFSAPVPPDGGLSPLHPNWGLRPQTPATQRRGRWRVIVSMRAVPSRFWVGLPAPLRPLDVSPSAIFFIFKGGFAAGKSTAQYIHKLTVM